MGAAAQALVALAARKSRIDGHAVARLQPVHGRTGFQHRARALVSQRRRILKDLVADVSFEIVMDIGAANAHTVDLQEHVVRPLEHGLGGVDQFDSAEGGEAGDFHVHGTRCHRLRLTRRAMPARVRCGT